MCLIDEVIKIEWDAIGMSATHSLVSRTFSRSIDRHMSARFLEGRRWQSYLFTSMVKSQSWGTTQNKWCQASSMYRWRRRTFTCSWSKTFS